jgi:hypothetical protein
MFACSGVRLPLRVLQLRHAVTVFVHVSLPPREAGIAQQEAAAAVRADLPVAHEQHRVREPRHVLVQPGARALDREDRLGGDARARAVAPPAAAKLLELRADRPRHELLGVVGDRFLQLHPGLGQAGHVDGEDQRAHDLGL